MKKLFLITLTLLIFSSCKTEKEESTSVKIGDFSFSSKDITANEPFTITYNGEEELGESFYYQLKNTKTYPKDLNFENKSVTITVPDSISAIAFNLKIDQEYSKNNGEGYLFTVVDAEGNSNKASEASKKFYAFSYGEDYGINVDLKETLSEIEKTLAKNPDLSSDWMITHMYLAGQEDSKKGKEVTNNYIALLNAKEELSLKEYEGLINIKYTTKNNKAADSLFKVVAEKYPNSLLATRSIINEFYAAESLDKKEAVFNENKDKILKSSSGSFVLQNLAMEYHNKGNLDTFNRYVNMMDKKTSIASMYNSIAWPKAEKGEDIEAASELSKKSLELIKTEQQDLKEKPNYYSVNQYKNSLVSTYNMYADTYALLAFKKGDFKEAIKYQAQAVEKDANAEMNERYIQFLIADKQYDTAQKKASEFIENGKSTAKLKTYFKEAVANNNNGEGDAETLLANLEAKAKTKELEHLRKKLIDEVAPDFTIKNLEGEEITLSSLKGKTVILDFWATWCGPCKASFPGMQKVVTKYKDNDNVKFFFVDTFEDGETRLEDVSKFIEDNNYDFNVLIDPKEEEGNNYIVAKKYKISGIPTKIIIGPSGNINFKSVGFGGSAESLVSEIDTMVELIN